MRDATNPAADQSESTNATWPAELDALIAAPRHHTLLFENAHVRVLDTRIAAGDTTPLHTHRWPAAMYILSTSDFVRCDADGEVLLDTREQAAPSAPPPVVWSAPLPPHTLHNVGVADVHVISVNPGYAIPLAI